MNGITLYHGSTQVVEAPSLRKGRDNTDFGRGFYCTESQELASEWACDGTSPYGFVNEYELSMDGLTVLDLDAAPYTKLNWIATILENREPGGTAAFQQQAARFAQAYRVDMAQADVVCGHRADDSYFRIMRYFLRSQITVGQLERALQLGGLGRQVVLKSQAAFDALRFKGASRVDASIWYAARSARDMRATKALMDILAEVPAEDGLRFWQLCEGER